MNKNIDSNRGFALPTKCNEQGLDGLQEDRPSIDNFPSRGHPDPPKSLRLVALLKSSP